jgi:hypothetical protein
MSEVAHLCAAAICQQACRQRICCERGTCRVAQSARFMSSRLFRRLAGAKKHGNRLAS